MYELAYSCTNSQLIPCLDISADSVRAKTDLPVLGAPMTQIFIRMYCGLLVHGVQIPEVLEFLNPLFHGEIRAGSFDNGASHEYKR